MLMMASNAQQNHTPLILSNIDFLRHRSSSLMIPRSVNPHVVFEKMKIVSRGSLTAEGDYEGNFHPDLSLVDELNAAMKRTLPPFSLEEKPKKRRKVEVVAKVEGEKRDTDELILFRLISNGSPVLVSLAHKQEAPIKVKEPEIEDDEAQARERRERALAVAVDADWVVQESLKPCRHSSAQSPILHLNLPVPQTSPSTLMILSHNKPVIKTRPPVQGKLGYPYDASAKPEPLENPARIGFVIDLNHTLESTDTKKPKRKRERKIKKLEHSFWCPDPNVKGKCMGYAMGFGMGRRR